MRPDEEVTFDEFVWHATAADRFADALHPEGAALRTVHEIRDAKYAEWCSYMRKLEEDVMRTCGITAQHIGKP